MAEPAILALSAVVVVSLVSLVGAVTLFVPGARNHRFLLVLVALAAGTLIGDAVLHLLPESIEAWDDDVGAMAPYILLGFVAFFIFEVALRGRHAHLERLEPDAHAGVGPAFEPHHVGHPHEHETHESHGPPVSQEARPSVTFGKTWEERAWREANKRRAEAAWVERQRGETHAETIDAHDARKPKRTKRLSAFAVTNLLGDALHNMLDGVAIAAAFLVDTAAGVATTIAVFLHEIPQEMADFGVLLRGGMSRARALMFNLASASLAILGAVVVLVLPLDPDGIQQYGLPFILGAFLYVGAADLIPELHHHSRGRDALLILLAFLVGLGIMFGIVGLEGVLGDAGHDHS